MNEDKVIPWWVGLFAFGLVLLILSLTAFVFRLSVLFLDADIVAAWTSSSEGLITQVLFMSAVFAGLSFSVPMLWRCSPIQWLKLSKVSLYLNVAAAVGVIGLGFLVDEIVYLLHSSNPVFFDPSGLDMFNQLFAKVSPVVFVILALTVTLGPGICEELFFRGLVLRSLCNSTSAVRAVAVSSILFGLVHFDVLQSPGAMIIGVYLGFLAVRSNSIYPAIVAHATNNLSCAIFARINNSSDNSNPITAGHNMWIVIIAALVFVVSSAFFYYITRFKTDKQRERNSYEKTT